MKPPFAEYEPFAAMYQIATCRHPRYDIPPQTSMHAKDFLLHTFQVKGPERPSAEALLDHRFVKDLT